MPTRTHAYQLLRVATDQESFGLYGRCPHKHDGLLAHIDTVSLEQREPVKQVHQHPPSSEGGSKPFGLRLASRLLRESLRVRVDKQLRRSLPKVVDDGLNLPALLGILDAVQIHILLVSVEVENVARFDCFRARLLVPEYQVNPLVQVGRDILRLLVGKGRGMACDLAAKGCGHTRTNASLCLMMKSSGEEAHGGKMTSFRVSPVCSLPRSRPGDGRRWQGQNKVPRWDGHVQNIVPTHICSTELYEAFRFYLRTHLCCE